MTPEQRFDIVVYRMKSAEDLLVEIKDHIRHGYYNTAMNRMYRGGLRNCPPDDRKGQA